MIYNLDDYRMVRKHNQRLIAAECFRFSANICEDTELQKKLCELTEKIDKNNRRVTKQLIQRLNGEL